MKQIGFTNPDIPLFKNHDITAAMVYTNCSAPFLANKSLENGEGVLADNGALCIHTGKFTGRAPRDRYIVKDAITCDRVDWNKINKPFDPGDFHILKDKMLRYLDGKDLYVQDVAAGADKDFRLHVRLIAEKSWSAQFAHNMFIRLSEEEVMGFNPEWHVLCVPSYLADPEVDNTRQENFVVINFSDKEIIIGGTGYTGEIKKSIFSVMNFILPLRDEVLPMHCSANEGEKGDVTIFFGLSGTGKTTLSADTGRKLIGDDEHGWSDKGVFNFEGGCYAKCIGLSAKKEPQIYKAIRQGAILENIGFKGTTTQPDYDSAHITENTRVSYPLFHIDNAKRPSEGSHPRNIFFLTCDAFGVLPPISRLTPGQTMYHFISGYTAKVAGTEAGVVEPQATFSACFGAPFLPLHPTTYAEMLGENIKLHRTRVWLVNTGWSGGPYGLGERIKLKYTRAMVAAAMNGLLENVRYNRLDLFNLQYPTFCPGVPSTVLNPRNTWHDMREYDRKAKDLAKLFSENFAEYVKFAGEELKNATVKLTVTA